MEQAKLDEYVRAFHMMWDNYPEPVRLIDRTFTIVAGNKLYMHNSGGRFLGTKCNQAGDSSLHRGCKAMESLRTGEARIVTTDMGACAGTPTGCPWRARTSCTSTSPTASAPTAR